MPSVLLPNRVLGLSVRGGGGGFPWANLPGGNALHAWDFLNNTARWNGASVGALSNTPGWSFARASAGYAQTAAGVLTHFASGELRRTDKGVLIEGARTNLCLQSQTFDNASWSKVRSSISADAIAAPDGTTTAATLTDDATNADHKVRQGIAVTSGTAYTLSVYAKANTLNYVWLYVGTPNVGTCFNLAAGTVLGSVGGTPTSSTISALGNGWYRCSITYTAGATSTQSHDIGTSANGTSFNYVGTGQNVYLWGAQLEAASFPSSYIPTTTASATRAADVLTVPVSLTAPFSLYVEGELTGSTIGVDWLLFDTLTNGSGIYSATGVAPAAWIRESSVTTANAPGGGAAAALNVAQKVAARFSANDTRTANQGTLGTADASNSPPATTTLKFGSPVFGGVSSLYIRRAAIWPRALTDAELTAVTGG